MPRVSPPTSPLPPLVQIDPFLPPSTQTNWSSLSPANQIGGGQLLTTGAQNAEIGWDIVLAAGTWELSLMVSRDGNRGIYTVLIDGVSVATLDGYGALANNIILTQAGIVVAQAGVKRLLLRMATKNASSTNYYGALQTLGLRKTA